MNVHVTLERDGKHFGVRECHLKELRYAGDLSLTSYFQAFIVFT